jgi:hypothetical protein
MRHDLSCSLIRKVHFTHLSLHYLYLLLDLADCFENPECLVYVGHDLRLLLFDRLSGIMITSKRPEYAYMSSCTTNFNDYLCELFSFSILLSILKAEIVKMISLS